MEDLIQRYNYVVLMGPRPRRIAQAKASAEIVVENLLNDKEDHRTDLHMEFVKDVCRCHPDMMENYVGHLLMAIYEEALHCIAGRARKMVRNVGHIYALGEDGQINEVVITIYPKVRKRPPKIFVISIEGGKPCSSSPTAKNYFLSNTMTEH